ncbi:MAG: TolC family protein [Treponema sp.]|nr:TolC family protein [Treponema sp.]
MSRVRFLVIAFFIFPLLPFTAIAEPVTLTMEDAVRHALDQSIHLRRGAIDLRLAEYSASRLWSEIFPSFSLNSSLTFLPATPLFTGGGFNYNADALSYSFNLGLSLSLNPSLRASMNRIELAFRQQLLTYEDARNQLEIRVVKDFLRLVTMQENISHMEENLQITTQTMENHRVAWETGHLNQLTWLNSQLSVQNALYELNTARGAYQNALWEFLALLGMDSDSDITLSGTVDIVPIRYDPEALILQYLPRRPDIVGQRHAIEMMELGRTVTTLSNRSPTLNFSTGWLGGSPPGNNRGLGAQFYDRITGSVTLNIPIDAWIPGTRQSQSIRAASAEVEKALLDLQHIQTSAKTEIRMIVSTLHNMWESLEIARLRVDIAERTLQAADEAFRNGAISFQEFEDRRRDLSDVRQRLLLGELNYQNLLLDLAAALNVEWRMLTQRSVNL